MDDMSHNDHQASDPHAGHTMSDMDGSHDRHAGHSVAMFRDKFLAEFRSHNSRRLLVNRRSTLVWLHSAFLPRLEVYPAILGTVVFVYGGLVFIRGAWNELADHKPGHDDAYQPGDHSRFWNFACCHIQVYSRLTFGGKVASLITIVVLGHWLEMRAISQARGALNALAGPPPGHR